MTDITSKVYTFDIVDTRVHEFEVGTLVVHEWDLLVPGIAPNGVPAGGLTDEVLAKVSAADYDVEWVDVGTLISLVTSVFGRQGAVVAAASDYDASQVDNDSGVTGVTVADALDTLAASGGAVDSVFGRTGVVVAQAGDYTSDQVTPGTTNLFFPEAPNDGGTYGRKDLGWSQITSGAALPLGLGTWAFSSTTTTPPATGEIRFDNANPALATKMYINETDGDSVNKSAVLGAVLEAGAEVYLQDRVDKNDYWLGEVVTATDQGTWYEVDMTNVSLTGTLTDGEPMVLVLLSQAATTAPVTSVFGRQGVVVAQANDYTWGFIDKAVSSIGDITTRSHVLLTDVGTNTHAQIDTHVASTANPHAVTAVQVGAAPTVHTHPLTALTQSGATTNDGVYWDGIQWTAGTLPAIVAAKEPTGFVDRADSTISFVDATRTFIITPTGAQFEVWQQGTQYLITSADSVVIPDVTGAHFIYFDEGVLTTTTTYSNDLIAKYGYVAYIYWNSAQASALLIGDERHGLVMSSATHQYLHLTRGAVIEDGFGLGSFTTDASGDLDVHAQFAAVAGTYWDEDIEIDIAALPFPANIPVVFLTGTGIWNKDTTTAFPVKNFVGGNGRLAWNEFTGGVWQQTEATSNDFVLCHIFATNAPTEPYIAVQGQGEYDTLSLARAGAIVELGNLTDPSGEVLTPELIAIGTIIYQTSNGYTNAVQARVRTTDEGTDYIPWTGGPDTLQYGTPPQSHTNLLDIGLNTHPQIDTHIADVANPHVVTAAQTEYRSGESTQITIDETVPYGVLIEPVVTDDGGLAISWGTGQVRTPGAINTVAGSGTCTDNAVNFLLWVSGTALTLTTTFPTDDNIIVAQINCQDGDIWAVHPAEQVRRITGDMHYGVASVMPSLVKEGLVVSEDPDVTNTHDVQVSSGVWFRHLHDEFDVSAFLSRNVPLVRWFHTAGAWDHDTNAEIDPSFWDNGTNLQSATTNRYYQSLFVMGDNVLHWIYPQQQFFTDTQAVGASPPELPPGLTGFPSVTGYVYEGSESAFGTGSRWIDRRVRIAEPVNVNAFGAISDLSTSIAADGIDTIRFVGNGGLTSAVTTITGTKQVTIALPSTANINVNQVTATTNVIAPNILSFTGVNIQNVITVPFGGSPQMDTIAEKTADAGVTIDGLLIKDGGIPEAAVTVHEAAIDHNALTNYVAAQHSVAEDIAIVLGDGSAVVSTGTFAPIPVKDDMTVVGWSLLADQSGSIQVDVWNDSYANYPATVADSIVTPSITTAIKNQATGLSISLSKGSHLIMNVDSVTTITECTVILHCERA